MSNEEKILELLSAMQKDLAGVKEDLADVKEDLAGVKEDLAGVKEDLAELKEAHEETRCGVNSLLEWAEECGNVIKFPLPRVK